ncbi:MAG: hypothetical protein J7500_13390 [Sphingomonas sp.]|uniref:hypothetical protein n=1 Tax=Sphingomonas sp. TaxID=28214 RepID=UPI001B29B8AD|nr:hypothetical protein [Sphingomonas sp.]MBO9623694.1 hypothetical protein [Sphingomonas sp.]
MTRRILLPAFVALALAGCESQPAQNNNVAPMPTAEPANIDEPEANVVGNEAEGNALAAVLNMSDRQRNVVFIRAILDAGLPCQAVTSSERLPDQDGRPLWRANCDGGASHMISITPDGTANIVSRTDR